VEASDFDRAQALLALIRNAMIDSGDHEALAQTISRLASAVQDRLSCSNGS